MVYFLNECKEGNFMLISQSCDLVHVKLSAMPIITEVSGALVISSIVI